MSGGSKQSEDRLEGLRVELAADAMTSTDEEILEDYRLQGLDPAAAAETVADVLLRAVATIGKQKMAAARAALREQQRRPQGISHINLWRAKELLENVARNDPDLEQRLTLAARNGDGLSERDIESMVADLIDLGVLREDDL